MCDVAKTADLVLLLIDGAFGFEMETFEFLNVAQTHGFPKVCFVCAWVCICVCFLCVGKYFLFL